MVYTEQQLFRQRSLLSKITNTVCDAIKEKNNSPSISRRTCPQRTVAGTRVWRRSRATRQRTDAGPPGRPRGSSRNAWPDCTAAPVRSRIVSFPASSPVEFAKLSYIYIMWPILPGGVLAKRPRLKFALQVNRN